MATSKTAKAAIGTLRVHGRDSKGIIAACSKVLSQAGCEIVSSEQWSDRKAISPHFFQRFQFTYCPSISSRFHSTDTTLATVCSQLQLTHELNWRSRQQRVGIMVSKYDHCLWELLLRYREKELDCEIPVVISNHRQLQHVADTFQIPFHYVPISPETKIDQEAEQLKLLQEVYNVDVIVLARYMQVLSSQFLNQFEKKIINIHHSFLPAFSGRRPYHRAFERGVKLIGATAHYTTEKLDDGPIIEQVRRLRKL